MIPNDVLAYMSQYVDVTDQRRWRSVNKAFARHKIDERICCSEPLPSELLQLIKENLALKIQSANFGGIRMDFTNGDLIFIHLDEQRIELSGKEDIDLTLPETLKYLQRFQLDYSEVNSWFIIHEVFSRRKSCPDYHICFIKFIRQHLPIPSSKDIVEVTELLEDVGRILNEEKFFQISDDFSVDIGQGKNEEMNASIPEFMQWLDNWISQIKPEDLGQFFIYKN